MGVCENKRKIGGRVVEKWFKRDSNKNKKRKFSALLLIQGSFSFLNKEKFGATEKKIMC